MAFHVLRLSPQTQPSPVPGPNSMQTLTSREPDSPSSLPRSTSVPHPGTDRVSLGCLTSLHLACTPLIYSFRVVWPSRTVICAHLSRLRCSRAVDKTLQ